MPAGYIKAGLLEGDLQRLGSVRLNTSATGTTSVFTLPAGYRGIVYYVDIHSATGVINLATTLVFSWQTAGAFGLVIPAMNTLTSSTSAIIPAVSNSRMTIGAAGDTFRVVVGGSVTTGTSCSIDVIGRIVA